MTPTNKKKNSETNKLDIKELRLFCFRRWPEHLGKTHGVNHWDRVAKFGEMLFVEGADMEVVKAFAYLHDSQRWDNAEDLEHGPRAAKFINTIRDSLLSALSDEQIAKLKRACELHTVEDRTGDITIDICFDADRMDLLRVGIKPLPERMASKQGAKLVSIPNYKKFYANFVASMKTEKKE